MVKKKSFIKELQALACREKKKAKPVSWEKLYVGKVSSIVYFKSRAVSRTWWREGDAGKCPVGNKILTVNKNVIFNNL